MPRLANQIVCVCAYLSHFKPVLVPPESTIQTENDPDVGDYFEDLSDLDSTGDECIDSD